MADHTDSETSRDLSLPGDAYVCAWTPGDKLALKLDSELLADTIERAARYRYRASCSLS
jgi:hypothetical protein